MKQLKTFIILGIFSLKIGNISAQCHIDDWSALSAIYTAASVNGPWINETGWSVVQQATPPANCDLSTLFGVSLNADGRVRSITLNNNGLSGTLTADIQLLTGLEKISITNSDIGGAIPVEIWSLPLIEDIRLFDTQFNGTIPADIGQATLLKKLNLYSNNLTGQLPIQIGMLMSLEELDLNGNNLIGAIPDQIGLLSNLTTLNLLSNDFSGNIPSSIGMLTNLERLYLRDNQLTGSIPKEFANLTNLVSLLISRNDLSGCFHPDLQVLCPAGFVDSAINGGNNFEQPWSAFCSTGAGSCDVSNNCNNNTDINYTSEQGHIYIDDVCYGVIMHSPDGNCYLLQVGFGGELTTTVVTCP